MANGVADKKTCFVVMGFGEKTDFQSNPQRVLDLNKTFEYIIQPAVQEAGLECIRADKIIHSTVIDKPMYEQLLEADLVIADLVDVERQRHLRARRATCTCDRTPPSSWPRKASRSRSTSTT